MLALGEVISTRGVKVVARTRSSTSPWATASKTGSRYGWSRYDGWATYASRRRIPVVVPRSSRTSFRIAAFGRAATRTGAASGRYSSRRRVIAPPAPSQKVTAPSSTGAPDKSGVAVTTTTVASARAEMRSVPDGSSPCERRNGTANRRACSTVSKGPVGGWR